MFCFMKQEGVTGTKYTLSSVNRPAQFFDLLHGFPPALSFHDALSVGFYRAS